MISSASNRKKSGWHLEVVLSEPGRTEETYLLVVEEGVGKESREKGRRRRGRGARSINA